MRMTSISKDWNVWGSSMKLFATLTKWVPGCDFAFKKQLKTRTYFHLFSIRHLFSFGLSFPMCEIQVHGPKWWAKKRRRSWKRTEIALWKDSHWKKGEKEKKSKKSWTCENREIVILIEVVPQKDIQLWTIPRVSKKMKFPCRLTFVLFPLSFSAYVHSIIEHVFARFAHICLFPFSCLQLLSKPKFSVLEKIKTIGSTYMVAAGLQPGKEGERAVSALSNKTFFNRNLIEFDTPLVELAKLLAKPVSDS